MASSNHIPTVNLSTVSHPQLGAKSFNTSVPMMTEQSLLLAPGFQLQWQQRSLISTQDSTPTPSCHPSLT